MLRLVDPWDAPSLHEEAMGACALCGRDLDADFDVPITHYGDGFVACQACADEQAASYYNQPSPYALPMGVVHGVCFAVAVLAGVLNEPVLFVAVMAIWLFIWASTQGA